MRQCCQAWSREGRKGGCHEPAVSSSQGDHYRCQRNGGDLASTERRAQWDQLSVDRRFGSREAEREALILATAPQEHEMCLEFVN